MSVEDRLFFPKYTNRKGQKCESINYAIRLTVKGKRTVRSLGTANRKEAILRAKRIIKSNDTTKWKLEAVERTPPNVTVEDHIRQYTSEKSGVLSPRTVSENVRVLRWFAKQTHARSLFDIYRSLSEKSGGRILESGSPATCQSRLAMLNSILPERITVRVPRQPLKHFLPLNVDIFSIQRKAVNELPVVLGNMVLLAGGCGLRSGEMCGVQRDHLSSNGLSVYAPKTRKWRQIPLDSTFITVLEGRFGPEGKLVYGYKDGLNRKICKWLRAQGIDDPKPLHYLRKHFGSELATKFGLYVAKEYLGHGSVTTTEKYYAALLERPILAWR